MRGSSFEASSADSSTALGARAGVMAGTRRIAVVGGAGYIGSRLCRLLLDRGASVECIDALWFGDQGIAPLRDHPRFRCTTVDLRRPTGLDERLSECSSVVHLAGLVGDRACDIDEGLTRACNYGATLALAERARVHGVERFVFASSCSVYGSAAQDEGASEDDRTAPLSLYARDKLACEQALVDLADDTFHPTSLRLATVYGWSPRMRFDLVANLFTARAVAGHSIRVFGGEQWRPLIHVDDVARAFAVVLEASLPQVSRRAFNVGSRRDNVRIIDLAQRVCDTVPGARVEGVPGSSDSRDYRVDFRRIQRELGFRPLQTLEAGIGEIARALQVEPIADIAAERYINEATTRRIWQDERAE